MRKGGILARGSCGLRSVGAVLVSLLFLAVGLAATRSWAQDDDPSTESGLTRYDQIRRDIERAGRSAKQGKLRNLVLDIDEELQDPAPLQETACWEHLKATALVELGQPDDAKATFKLLVDTCPTWEALNNLAVLQAADGEYGPARTHLGLAIDRALVMEKVLPRSNLEALQADENEPFLILAGFIGECTEVPVPRADCEGRLLLSALLKEGGDPVPARFLVFEEADELGDRRLAADSEGEVDRFEVSLPEGNYRVAVAVGQAGVQRDVALAAGSTTAVPLVLSAGRIEASWRIAEGTPRMAASFQLVADDGAVVAESEARALGFSAIVPAGSYGLEVEDGPLRQETSVTIVPGGHEVQELDMGVDEALERWRTAWQERNVDEFVFSYLDGFTPDAETSHNAWARDRVEKISNKRTIQVNVSDVRYSRPGPDRVAATFTQEYQACPEDDAKEPMCDAGVKTLTFVHTDDGWKIEHQEFEETAKGCPEDLCP